MGTIVDRAGITVQLYDDDGEPMGTPFFGKFAELRGQAQSTVTQTASLRGDEVDFPGSADWLTLIAVADTEDRLNKILSETTVADTKANTSGSSRRVQVDIHVGDRRLSYPGRTTIASGPVLPFKPDEPPAMHVVHVKVLAEGARLADDHPLVKDFRGMTPFFR